MSRNPTDLSSMVQSLNHITKHMWHIVIVGLLDLYWVAVDQKKKKIKVNIHLEQLWTEMQGSESI